jgi:S-formylglutathione hydrolase FrmB
MTVRRTDPRLRIRPVRRRRLAAIVGLALAAAVASAAPAEARLGEFAFSSAALGREMKTRVIRPASGADRPVLLLLHGRGRHRNSLLELDDTRDALLAADLWIFLPDGEDGWYIDSPVDPGSRYAAYLDELLAEIVARYPVARDVRRWAVAGWSMGGYGAVSLAQRRPERFGAVAAIVGLLDFPREETLPAGRNYTVPAVRFGTDREVWKQYNPLHRIDALRDKAVLLITAEDAFDRVMNENFSSALTAAGVRHRFVLRPGGHTLEVVRAAVPEVLAFVRAASEPRNQP